MNAPEFERTLLEFRKRKPFQPFVVELKDGKLIRFDQPGALAIRDGSAVFLNRTQYEQFSCVNVLQIVATSSNSTRTNPG
jgi:hypothetical protein